jgi:N-methylhydantoinase A
VTYRLGVDIGGTFTDASLVDEESGRLWIEKVSTTPADPSLGFMQAVEAILRRAGVDAAGVRAVVHATTVATNAIIEGTTARTAFVTTAGFRDLLEIARQTRPVLYDLRFEKLRPLVPRDLCFEVVERLDARGGVLVPLDERSVREVAERLGAEGVEAVAVCLLHAYREPAHERRVGEILREELPQTVVSLSSEVAPEFREYLRASTTVVNASVQPVVGRYLRRIEDRLAAGGVAGRLLVMQSGGGVFSARAAGGRPVFMVESGPAAGVIAAAELGRELGRARLISFDMGGTTAKLGLVLDGTPTVTKEYQVGAAAQAGIGGMAHGGYPVRTPVVDLVEIGAGGGSIAWVDEGGALRVGPRSAGADPGPACYGRGGREPTVTDANLALGRLDPRSFLGGAITLDAEAAGAAIEERVARPLGLDVPAAANGIVEIANAAMVNALQLVSVQRGWDPREFALVAFGGAGPSHAVALARECGIACVVVPTAPGVFTARGMLGTDLERSSARTLLARLDGLDADAAERVLAELEAEGRAELAAEGTPAADMRFRRQADVRYVGQSFELTVPLPADPLDAAAVLELAEAFHAEHGRAYGFSAPGEPVELVALRVVAVGRIARPRTVEVEAAPGPAEALSRRPVWFAEAGGEVEAAVHGRYRLGAGALVRGPAVVEELDSITVVPPGWRAEVDRHGNLLLEPEEESP